MSVSQSVYLVVSYIGGPPVPYNYETSVMVPTYLISRLGFLRKCKGRVYDVIVQKGGKMKTIRIILMLVDLNFSLQAGF
jgi:hypothetical protein